MPRMKGSDKKILSGFALSSALLVAPAVTVHATETPSEVVGIAGTGLQGIAGTGLQGIAGTGVQGIAGTGVQGIAGTGLDGIAGTGLEGIAGTGLQGIAGTGLDGIAGTGLQGIAGTGIQSGLPIVAIGPVGAVSDDGYQVLGQAVVAVDPALMSRFNVGDTVVVYGLTSDAGIFANRIVPLEAVAEGTSLVFVAGIVTEGSEADGTFGIGDLRVQVGSAGFEPALFDLEAGHYVEVIGYHFGGQVVAESIVDGGPTVD